MHCELAVPGLFGGSTEARAPALELLLARGRSASGESRSLEGWLQQEFALGTGPMAAGALTLVGCGADPGNACWARADPVHLRLMRDRLIVVPGAALALSREEADALAEALNRHFSGVLSLRVAEPRRWCAELAQELSLDAPAALEAAGRDVDLTARIGGEAGKRWARLLNEAQMLLHAHPVNQAREARGEATVNSLWLWGTGRLPQAVSGRWRTISASDPLPLGLARRSGAQARALPESGHDWLAGASTDGRHLIVLDALRAPLALGQAAEYRECIEALERLWFAPLLAALRAGRAGMLSLHVPDAAASFETVRGDLRRFWRRRRALERYA
jgi:hypothetical protein